MLTFPLGLDEALEKILDFLGNVVEYDSASIQLFDSDGILYLAAGRGFDDIEKARRISREMGSHEIQKKRWAEKRVIVIPDTHRDYRWIINPGWDYIRSWVGAPLLSKNRLIGILNIDNREPNAYDSTTGETVMAFANLAAIAIENARLFEAERSARELAEALHDAEGRRVAEMETVRKASLTLTASLDLPQVLDAILKGALDLLPGSSSGSIYLYNQDGARRLKFGAELFKGERRNWPWKEPRPDGLTYTVARTEEMIVIEDMASHPLYTNVYPDWEGSAVGLPLKIGHRVVGVMIIAFRQPHALVENELHMLCLLGDQAAIAIENARLFEQAATERKHLSLLYDIGRKLSTTLDVDEILNHAVQLTAQALGGLVGTGFLYQPDVDRLYLRALYGWEPLPLGEADAALGLSSERGIEGWVVRHRQGVVVPDVSQDPHWLFITGLDEPIKSAICAPILDGDRLLGVLTVLHDQVAAFKEDHMALMQAICQQIGLALGNATRYRQVEELAHLLSAKQQTLESLVEHLPVGVLLLDSHKHLLVSNPTGRAIITDLNGEITDTAITHIGPHSLETLFSSFGESIPVEIVRESLPRRFFNVEVRQINGADLNWVVMLREITQERDNQARIQMQERLATVGQLAAGIAHDFNNIMAAILVYTDLLIREPNLSAASLERLEIIQKQVDRAASLIRQILDFSRRSVMEQSPLDLLPFIKELDRLLRRMMPENIRLALDYLPGNYRVNADPTRLQQVFMNLAVNARDAMPQGGVLSFDLKTVRLNFGEIPPVPGMSVGEWVRIVVRDTGMGISEDVLPHIFEPFFTTKPVGQGTGLGLAQVYGIIKQHGGAIDVNSQSGIGTSFVIYLPALAEPNASDHLQKLPDMLDGAGQTLLLVEDDPTTCQALKTLLETQDYRVLTASDGLEALRCYDSASDTIVMVISDLVMPHMGGVDLYHALQQRWPEVKMLFITGHPLDGPSKSLLEQGGVHWLQKPFSIQDLGQAMVTLLSRET